MRLTAFTDYSLRVLIYLAADPQRRATIGEIAKAFGISENHLTKVVHFLGKAHWLDNVRGKGGGLKLACQPNALTVGTVVRRTEEGLALVECFDAQSNACRITPVCALRGALAEANEAFYRALDGYTIADLVRRPQSLGRILFVGRTERAAPAH